MKDIWTVLPKPECKHPKNKVIKNELGWLCKGCMAYIDKNMITKQEAQSKYDEVMGGGK